MLVFISNEWAAYDAATLRQFLIPIRLKLVNELCNTLESHLAVQRRIEVEFQLTVMRMRMRIRMIDERVR